MPGKAEIQRLKDRLEAATLAANVGIWDWDLRTGQVYWTPTLEAIYGLTPSAARSYDDFRSRVHPEDLESTEQARDAAVSRREPFTLKFRIIRPDGSIRWIEAKGRAFHDADGNVMNIMGANQDITERENMQQALMASEERYRTVVADQTELISRYLPDRTFTFVNEVFCRVFGKSADELVGVCWNPVVFPDDLPLIEAKLGEMSAGNPIVTIENRVYVAGGQLRWMQFVNRGFYNADRRLTEIQSVGRDITRLKQTETDLRERENELQRSKQQLELALEASGLGAWDVDFRTGHVARDHNFLGMIGYAEGELEPDYESFRRLAHPDDLAAVEGAASAHFRGETPTYESEHRLRHKDGHYVWVFSSGKVVERDADGNPLRIIGTNRNITQRKRLNEEGTELLKRIEALIRDAASGAPGTPAEDDPVQKLTRRQRQTVTMIAKGMTSAQIASELNISTDTAIGHRRELMKKLGLHSAAEVARFAVRHKLVND